MLKNKKQNKIIAIALSAVLLVSAIAIGLVGTFAKTDREHIPFTNPHSAGYLQLTVGGSTRDINVQFTNEWRSTNANVATVTAKDANNGTVAPVDSGTAAIFSATRQGSTNSINVQVENKNYIAEYWYEDGRSANLKKAGDELNINDKLTTKNGNAASVNGSIKWESWGEEFATVTQAGLIKAVKEGTAIIVGKVTDCWGAEQLIPYTVVVGNPYAEKLGDGVVKIGDDYYKPVPGDPGVWEKTDATGQQSTGEYFGGNMEIPNPLEPLYKITADDNKKDPPAKDFSDSYPGYLTTKPEEYSEYDRWQKALNEKDPPSDQIPTGVSGRMLSAEKAGDTSAWIEIARNGDYSLILRAFCVKQNTLFNTNANSAYAGSLLETRMNNFYTQLSSNSNLKKYVVMSNATSRIIKGTSLTNVNGFSVPSTSKPTTTSGVAFPLSYQEYALFCSLKNYSSTSPATARDNYNLLKVYGDVDLSESATRTPESSTCFYHIRSKYRSGDGYFHYDLTNYSFPEGAGYWAEASYGTGWGVRPAMWVDSAIFNQ